MIITVTALGCVELFKLMAIAGIITATLLFIQIIVCVHFTVGKRGFRAFFPI